MANKPMQPGVAVEPHAGQCGASTRSARPCTNKAGFRTDHVGQGRCYLHGGLTPIKHGRYSGVMREDLATILDEMEAETDAEKLNILPEATMIRALAKGFVERYEDLVEALMEWNTLEYAEAQSEKRKPRPQRIPDINEVANLLVAASSVVDKIHKQRSDSAISRKDFLRVMTEMGRAVEARVGDVKVLEKIRDDWSTIRLA